MSSPRKGNPYRRFALTIAGTATAIFTVFTIVNTWVNPLWVSPAPWTDDSFAEFRQIYRQQRTGKAGIAASQAWKAAFFGSSRIDIAFDPENPNWQETAAVNLAVSAGTLPESAPILSYTLDHAPLETAIVGIDIGDLMWPNSPYRTTGFLESPFNPKRDRFEQTLRYYVGISSFEISVKTINNRRADRLPDYTTHGHRLRVKKPANIDKVIARDTISHALRTSRRRRVNPPGEGNPFKLQLLQQMLDDSKEHHCRLVLIIPPSHVVYLGVYYYIGDPDPTFSRDRSVLTRMVAQSNAAHPDAPPAEIWDFNDFHPLNAESITTGQTEMDYWVDGTHARKELGDIMLARIMGWPISGPGADYGFQLTADNLDSRLKSLKQGYHDFKSQRPKQWQWMVDKIGIYQEP